MPFTSGSWKHALYGGSRLRSEQKKYCISAIVKCCEMLFLLGPEVQFNRVFLWGRWCDYWTGVVMNGRVLIHFTHMFFVWDYSLHRGSSFCCCQKKMMGIGTWSCWLEEICGENRTGWWAKLDNSQKGGPKRYTLQAMKICQVFCTWYILW